MNVMFVIDGQDYEAWYAEVAPQIGDHVSFARGEDAEPEHYHVAQVTHVYELGARPNLIVDLEPLEEE